MRQHFFSLKNSTSFRQNMLKFYRIFRIAWKFLAKFVKCCRKKLYYTAFFGKIFRQDFSLWFDSKRQHFLHRLAFAVGICRIMTKNAVYDSVFWYYSTKKLVSKDVCRKMFVEKYYKNMVSENEVDNVYKKLFRITWLLYSDIVQYKYKIN